MTKEWIDHIVGRNWELYWAPSSDSTSDPELSATKENQDETETDTSPNSEKKRRLNDDEPENKIDQQSSSDSLEGDEDEADWYAARVVKFLSYDQGDVSKPIFQVLFVGDEDIYSECLTPASVRPCTRTWVKRTFSLLDGVHSNSNVDINKPLHEQLPIDTRRLQDEAGLTSIRQSVDHGLLSASHAIEWRGSSGSTNRFVEQFEHDRIREMLCLIRSQIYLRAYLVPTALPQGRHNSLTEEELITSEPYVAFLVSCLELAERCCVWFDRCYRRLCQLHGGAEGDTSFEKDEIRQIYAAGGKETLSNLLALDPSPIGFKRKRRGTTTLPPAKARRTTKSRRRTNGVSNYVVEEESGAKYLDIEEDDLESEEFVNGLLERLAIEDGRWFSHSIGRLLVTFLDCVILPMVKWDKQSLVYLGFVDLDETELPTISNPSETNDSDEDASKISLEQIESHVSYQSEDLVLSKLNFDESKQQLQKKVKAVLEFEGKCWTAIKCITNEIGASPHRPEDDNDLAALKALLDTSNQPTAVVGNMSCFGRAPSALSRADLEIACTHRLWFLDLLHAEVSREREQFLQHIITRYSTLPPLPIQSDGSNPVQRDMVEPRVKALMLLLEKNKAFLESQEALCSERQNSPILSIPQMESFISELQCIKIVSRAEEMAVCRKDLLLWIQKANVILEQRLPSFTEIEKLGTALEHLTVGRSTGRLSLAQNLRTVPDIDVAIQQFVEDDMNAFCSETKEKCLHLYATSKWWKERFDAISTSLVFYKNNSFLTGHSVAQGSKASPAMVDLKRIEDLLIDYPGLQTCLKVEHSFLLRASEECRLWSDHVNQILLGDKNHSFSRITKEIEVANRPDGRPKGIILSPTRQNLDLVLDLLRWHTSVKSLKTTDGSFDATQGYHVLFEGIEIVEMFANYLEKPEVEHYTPKVDSTKVLLRRKLDSRKSFRCFSLTKLESNPLTKSLLSRMIDSNRDSAEGFPIFSLLTLSWTVEAEDFAERFLNQEKNADASLDNALVLNSLKPCHDTAGTFLFQTHFFSEFNRLVKEAVTKRESITETLSLRKSILRKSLSNPDTVRCHLAALKEHQSDLKRETKSLLKLPETLSSELEKETKLFMWLVRNATEMNPGCFFCTMSDNCLLSFRVRLGRYSIRMCLLRKIQTMSNPTTASLNVFRGMS